VQVIAAVLIRVAATAMQVVARAVVIVIPVAAVAMEVVATAVVIRVAATAVQALVARGKG
jgi:hypothetical protein